MSRQERTGKRDLTFSAWHRTLSDRCNAIDIDWCEWCIDCKTPLALIETTRSTGFKPTTVTEKLARMAGIRAYLIHYVINDGGAITRFGVCQLVPKRTKVIPRTVDQVRQLFEKIHAKENCSGCK